MAGDQQFRLWVPLKQMAPKLPEAVMLYEDRWFRFHPGVNPAALFRAVYVTYGGGGSRQGGSTITMQLARRLYEIDSRHVPGKLKQIALAVWLELLYGKNELLEAYLNLAPYGGNVEGVGAASLVYFQKSAARITLPEALTLAVIPQNPHRRLAVHLPDQAGSLPAELDRARTRLWQGWLATHPDDTRFAADMKLALRPSTVSQLPFRAPHLVEMLLQRHSGETEIFSSIDLKLQQTLERIIRNYLDQHRSLSFNNAAAMLLDSSTMQVKAMVGSADYFNNSISGQVNGISAKRSPGSTLKPFVYALALDQGVLHPYTILKDAPTSFGPFTPENFDGRFVGPITAQDALIRSRNIPAVSVAAKLSRPTLYDFLKSAGISKMATEQHYGLALTLGGGDVTIEELATLYALLANYGLWQPLRYDKEMRPPAGTEPAKRLLSEDASFIILDMLSANPRPDTGLKSIFPVSWKTGTSWGFRDAWSAGVFSRYVLVVWIGNFDNSSNPAFIGISAAAPLFFQIIDGIRSRGLDQGKVSRTKPQNLELVDVCAASGDLPNEFCPQVETTWFIPGKSPIRVCTLHRPVFIDNRSGQAVCKESPSTQREIYEFWPSDMLHLFRQAGMPRRRPPSLPNCGSQSQMETGDAPQITSPLRGASYNIRLSKPMPISLKANSAGNASNLYWFADKSFLGKTGSGAVLNWIAPAAGHYILHVVDDLGRSDSREVVVEFLP